MKLSVIIPMYNGGRFISDCLRSCLCQDIPALDYQIIVVDDGSTDGGASLVEDLKVIHGWTNVSVIRRPNGGASAARNTGLEAASGEYVWFVDADDWIRDNCLSSLLEEAEGNDILVFGSVDYHSRNGVMEPGDVYSYPEDAVRSGTGHVRVMSEKLKMCVPFCVFRKDFLVGKGIRFVPGLLHEDAEYIPRVFCEAGKVRVSTRTPYCRLVRDNSMSRQYDPRRVDALLTVASRLREYADSRHFGKEMDAPINSVISNVLNQSFKLARDFSGPGDNIKSGLALKLDGMPWYRKTFLGAKELKYKVEGILISLFPGRPVEVYSFLSFLKGLVVPKDGGK